MSSILIKFGIMAGQWQSVQDGFYLGNTGALIKYGFDGSVQWEYTTGSDNIPYHGLTVGADKYSYIIYGNIRKLDPDGNLSWIFEKLSDQGQRNFSGLCVDKNGNIYASTNSTLHSYGFGDATLIKISANGDLLWVNDWIGHIDNVEVDKDGYTYIFYDVSSSIRRFSKMQNTGSSRVWTIDVYDHGGYYNPIAIDKTNTYVYAAMDVYYVLHKERASDGEEINATMISNADSYIVMIAIDKDNNVITTATDALTKLDTNFNKVWQQTDGTYYGVVASKDGFYYVSIRSGGIPKILKLNSSGVPVAQYDDIPTSRRLAGDPCVIGSNPNAWL